MAAATARQAQSNTGAAAEAKEDAQATFKAGQAGAETEAEAPAAHVQVLMQAASQAVSSKSDSPATCNAATADHEANRMAIDAKEDGAFHEDTGAEVGGHAAGKHIIPAFKQCMPGLTK